MKSAGWRLGALRSKKIYRIAFAACGLLGSFVYAADITEVDPVWGKAIGVNKTVVSLQVCMEPPLRRESPIHDRLFKSIRDLKTDYVRLQPWFPYPKLAVAALEPPANGKTSWDFSLLDPWMIDFFEASEGRPVMVNFGTIPQWMLKREKPNSYPSNPDEIDWNYSVDSNELRDPTIRELRDYYVRLVSWYTKGGFTDEYGKKYTSGHRFKIDYWEVLNEVDAGEYPWSPEQYTRIYDEIVGALKSIQPEMKFSGLALADGFDPKYFEYFLNPKNHKPGIPIDMVSYHFYAIPSMDESPEVQQFTFFDKADSFTWMVSYAEAIRKRLSPETKVYINEVGTITADMISLKPVIADSYWNLSGSMFAYLYIRLAQMGIDAVAGAELIDYPGQVPGATLSDWNTGQPNARYWVLKLLRDQINIGDQLIDTMDLNQFPRPSYAAQAYLSKSGGRKILIVNKRDREIELRFPNAHGGTIDYVDQTTASNPPARRRFEGDTIKLRGFAVAVINLSK